MFWVWVVLRTFILIHEYTNTRIHEYTNRQIHEKNFFYRLAIENFFYVYFIGVVHLDFNSFYFNSLLYIWIVYIFELFIYLNSLYIWIVYTFECLFINLTQIIL